MYDPLTWALHTQMLVDLIPRANGEDEDGRIERIARTAGVSRSTLYRILKGEPTGMYSLAGWLRMLNLVPAAREPEKLRHIENVLSAHKVRLEKN